MFIKAVSKYFMNFLETDFKRRRVPKRSISFADKAGNLTAFRLDKYPTFLRKISSLINDDNADYSIVVSRGTYTSNLSNNLSEVVTKSALKVLQRLEEIVVGMGGRLYLTKDAVMQEATFKFTYRKWGEFEAIREKYGAIGKFSSAQSKRLGLA